MDQLTKDVVRSTIQLLTESKPPHVEALFVHGRGIGDDCEVLEHTGRLYRYMNPKPEVFITGGTGHWPDGRLGWRGYEAWAKDLRDRHNLPTTATAVAYNTIEENRAFLASARAAGLKTAYIVMLPHQALRAMLGMVQTMWLEDYPMRVWCSCPPGIDWSINVSGSPDVVGPRHTHIAAELERISRYQAKGDLASFERLYQYLAHEHDNVG